MTTTAAESTTARPGNEGRPDVGHRLSETGQWFDSADGVHWWFDSGCLCLDFAYTGGMAAPRDGERVPNEPWERLGTPADLTAWLHDRFPAIDASCADHELRFIYADEGVAPHHDWASVIILSIGPVRDRTAWFVEQLGGGALEQGGDRVVAGRFLQAENVGKPLGRRHNEACRVNESEQLEQVEPRQVRITQPAGDERSVEQQQRSVRRSHHRIALRGGARASLTGSEPASGMAGVKRRKRKRVHQTAMRRGERKVNIRRPSPHCQMINGPARAGIAARLIVI